MSKNQKPRDPNGPHVRVYHSLLNSIAWRCLGPSACKLYFDLRVKLNGSNNGNISATLGELKHRGWVSSSTLSNALYELRVAGFIRQTRGGGVRDGSKVCALYAFTDLPVLEFPKIGIQAASASNDFLRFKSVDEAKQEFRRGIEALRRPASKSPAARPTKKKKTLRNPNRDASNSELSSPIDASNSEQVAAFSARISNTIDSVEFREEARQQ